MNRKERIDELRSLGNTYQQIANIISNEYGKISSARVWTIFNGYSPSHKNRTEALIRDSYTCQWNKVCNGLKNNDIVVHHIDENDRNNEISNLITLCRNCHSYFHKLEKKKFIYFCKNCKKDIHSSATYCEECNKIWCRSYNLSECKGCHSDKFKHRALGMCENCYTKYRYHNIPNVKEKILKATRIWMLNNPEKNKIINDRASKKYCLKKKALLKT